jgi:aminoglycoside 6'-N-acetyltransferase I
MIRLMEKRDEPEVIKMMYDLWPDDFDGKLIENETVFVYEHQGKLNAFITIGIRPYVDGADSSPCPHIEGWYVAPDSRRQGVGAELIKAAENWATSQGFTELTSDVLLENTVSLQAHEALGFKPTEKIQYFKKELK